MKLGAMCERVKHQHDKTDNPAQENDSHPCGPPFDGVLQAMDTSLGEDLKHDGSGGNQTVKYPDDDDCPRIDHDNAIRQAIGY